jgi:hypothetical protein
MEDGYILKLAVESLPNASQSWIDILSALLVPAIALFGVFIAYQQYRVNQQRLRHETYERRLSVYKVVQKYLSEIVRDGKTSYERALQFKTDASEAQFLFDDSVQNRIDEIYQHSLTMIAANEKLYPSHEGVEGLPVGEERNTVSEEKSAELLWHAEELVNSRSFFAQKLGVNVK